MESAKFYTNAFHEGRSESSDFCCLIVEQVFSPAESPLTVATLESALSMSDFVRWVPIVCCLRGAGTRTKIPRSRGLGKPK